MPMPRNNSRQTVVIEKFNLTDFRNLPLPGEAAIKASWEYAQPLVSVVCTTYNHEIFIDDAIRGFLIQKTRFPFEIIIHDDASTDDTASVVKRYADAYPSLIRPVLQQKNLYSQGVLMMLHAAGYANGDLIAYCEGDDYWIAADKLQTQVEAMAEHPECEISFHSAVKTAKEIPFDLPYCKRRQGDGPIDVRAIIRCGGSYMPTAAMMIRKSFFERIAQDDSGFYQKYLDAYFFQIFCSLSGGAYYIDRSLSVYRSFAEGSWTEKSQLDAEFYIRWSLHHLVRMQEANRKTASKYDAEFQYAIKRAYLSFLNNINIDVHRREYFYHEHRKELDILGRLLWHFVLRFRPVHEAFIGLRAYVNNRLKQGLI